MSAALPPEQQVIHFEYIGSCYWLHVGFRAPQAGEYFVSGNPVDAFVARQNLNTHFHIVRPTFHAKRGWTRGARVDVPQVRPQMAREDARGTPGTSMQGKGRFS